MEKIGIYEVNVYKNDVLVETSYWETDLPPAQIATYYKGFTVDVKESKYRQKIRTKAEIEEIES